MKEKEDGCNCSLTEEGRLLYYHGQKEMTACVTQLAYLGWADAGFQI